MTVTLTSVSAGTASGSYISQSDVYNVFGEDNVTIWSNLDNDNTNANDDRIQTGIDWAEEYIEGRFRDSRYAVPFSSPGEQIKNWCATLAGLWLYNSRGLTDNNEDSNKYKEMRKNVDIEISRAIAGISKLSEAKVDSENPSGAMVV